MKKNKIILLVIGISLLLPVHVFSRTSQRGLGFALIVTYQGTEVKKIEIENTNVYEVLTPTPSLPENGELFYLEVLDAEEQSLGRTYVNLRPRQEGQEGRFSYKVSWSESAKFLAIKKGTKEYDRVDAGGYRVIDNKAEASKGQTDSNFATLDLKEYAKEQSISSADGKVTIVFPEGTFSEPVFLLLEKLDRMNIHYPSADYSTISSVYQLKGRNGKGEELTKLKKAGTITFKVGQDYKKYRSAQNKITSVSLDAVDQKLSFLDTSENKEELTASADTLSSYFVSSYKKAKTPILTQIFGNKDYTPLVAVLVGLFLLFVGAGIYNRLKRHRKN